MDRLYNENILFDDFCSYDSDEAAVANRVLSFYAVNTPAVSVTATISALPLSSIMYSAAGNCFEPSIILDGSSSYAISWMTAPYFPAAVTLNDTDLLATASPYIIASGSAENIKFVLDYTQAAIPSTGAIRHQGVGRSANEIYRKFSDGATLSANFVRQSLSTIRGHSAILPIEWSNFAAHTYFNSAELKTNAALSKVISGYPIGLSGTATNALSTFDIISVNNFLLKLDGFEKYVLNYLGGVTGNSYLCPNPVLTASATSIGNVIVPLIALGRDSKNGLTGEFVTLSANLYSLAQTFDAGLNTLQLISGTAVDFDIVYFDDGTYFTGKTLPSTRIEYVNRQSDMGSWIPEALKMNDTENNLIRFMGTVGAIYDDIKLYIDQFANVNHITYDNWSRYADGRIPSLIAKHFGFELIDALLRQDLSLYLRKDTNKVPLYEITYKIWNRILNNLIYLYKKKGTIEAVRSLVRIYGIPDNYISIDDFNFHPEPTTTTKIDYKNVRVLSFNGRDRINFDFSPYNILGTNDITLEARVTASSITSAGCILALGGDGAYDTAVEYDGISASLRSNNAADVSIKISTSSSVAELNSAVATKWVNFFGIRRGTCGEIWATWIDESSGSAVFHAVSAVGAWANMHAPAVAGFFIGAGSTGVLGNNAVVSGWTGDIQEVKVFKFALGPDDIREHTHNFESVSWMGNTSNGSFDGVVAQWKLKENTILSGSNWVVNSWTLSSSLTGYGQGTLTANNRYKMIEFMRKETQFTNIGEFADDNVDLYIQEGTTSPWKKSNILNIGFRPVTRINDDILNVYGDLNTSNVIGDPSNFLMTVNGYSSSYPVEVASASQIFRRWNLSHKGAKIDFNNYIKVLENLAPLIEGILHDAAQLIPARTVLINRGVIIENHLLESSRVHTNPPEFITEHDYNDTLNPVLNFISSDIVYETKQSIFPDENILSLDEEYPNKEITQIVNPAFAEIKDILYVNEGIEKREEFSGKSVGTSDYFTISLEQLQDLQNNLSINEFRIVGLDTIYPYEQAVYNPDDTKLLIQVNRNFLRNDSAINDWTTSISGTIQLVRTKTGKALSSKEKCVRLVVPSSITTDINGTITASEHWTNVVVNSYALNDTEATYDFTMPNKNGLNFQLTRKSKYLDTSIGFLTFQFTNLLSGQVGQFTILVSVDDSELGGIAELQAELMV